MPTSWYAATPPPEIRPEFSSTAGLTAHLSDLAKLQSPAEGGLVKLPRLPVAETRERGATFPDEANQTFSGVMISKGTLRWRIEPLSF